MNVGLIVEGSDDVETYPVLITRVRPQVTSVFTVECGGKRNLKRKFVPFLKRHFQERRDRAVRKVFVIRDSDCSPSPAIERELEGILTQSRTHLDFEVHFFAIKCKLESWLLADEEAINRVALQRGRPGGVQPIRVALETYKDADRLLEQTLWRAGVEITPKVYAEIAEGLNVERLAQRCPYFQEFTARVHAC